MKFATLYTAEGLQPALQDGDVWKLLDAPDVKSVLGQPVSSLKFRQASAIAASAAKFAAPISNPGKVFCVGMNYHSHAAELGMPIPKYPNLWAKFTESMIGPSDDIHLPPPEESTSGDYEVELVIVIGRTCRRISEAEALGAVAGFCVGNDSSVRDWQVRTREIMQGKAWEHMTPTGPWLTTLDELAEPSALKMSVHVNGEIRQDSSTSDMIFSPAWLVAYISTFITLQPGDLILTGTPSGVGFTRKPPVFLRAGDVVRCEIEGLGIIENRCSLHKETLDEKI